MDDVGPLPHVAMMAPCAGVARSVGLGFDPQSTGRLFADLDRRFHAAEGRLTSGGSPLALGLASADWAAHMINAPFRRSQLGTAAWTQWMRFWQGVVGGEGIQPASGDHRFKDPQWNALPFNLYEQGFLLVQEWMEAATKDVPGVSPENERLVNFAARQWLDIFSPSNAPWANPEVLRATTATKGLNLLRGAQAYMADLTKFAGAPEPETEGALKVGRDLAVTPGKVLFRNHLIELIQYSPQTETVHPEPVLITPAWIMKYYILDLSPHNSLIRYLVEQGYTVFCISWRNPGAELRDVPFDAYRQDGLMAAVDAVSAIRPDAKIHACGYCLGGTLLTIGAAAMARDGDDRLADVTLFCAQSDFTEAGELLLFTTEDQVSFLEDVMSVQGYLDGRQMGGAFEMLRSRDLTWSRLLKTYWLDETDPPNDLMTWNGDATRMPAHMHSEYLRKLFLGNDLAEGRFQVGDQPVSVGDIRVPLFVVSTETDHVAPWRSVYKINLLNEGEITFLLTTGGHNAGIVSEPGHPHRSFHIYTRAAGTRYVGPEAWLTSAERREGSWWPAWTDWLTARSGARDMAPASLGSAEHAYAPLGDAPGQYVLER